MIFNPGPEDDTPAASEVELRCLMNAIKEAKAARAVARIAIQHLQNTRKADHPSVRRADRAKWLQDADDWLASIGSDPA